MEKDINEEFKNVENQLLEVLNDARLDVSKNDNSKHLLKKIKDHIAKVEKAKILFEKYEELAKKICNYEDDDDVQVLKKDETIENVNVEQSKTIEKNKKIATKKSNKTPLIQQISQNK